MLCYAIICLLGGDDVATVSLYTQPSEQGLRNFEAGSFSIQDLEKGTDYVEVGLDEIQISTLHTSAYILKLTIPLSGTVNLSVNKNNSPVTIGTLDEYETSVGDVPVTILKPSTYNFDEPLLDTRPADWDMHWRDKYTEKIASQAVQSTPVLTSGVLVAPTSGGTPYERPFEANKYF